MDIGSSFTQIINKALGIDGFFPYNTDTNFLLGMQQDPFTPHSTVGFELIRSGSAWCHAPYMSLLSQALPPSSCKEDEGALGTTM